MAMALAVATRLVSDAHNSPSTENTPSAVHRLQMAIADTECAQALLELAMSIVPAPPSPPYTESASASSATFDTKTNPAPTKSLLKREFDADGDLLSVLSDEEVYWQDVVKHIKLDHNYYWTGDERRSQDRKIGEVILEPDQFRTYCESIKQNGSVPTSSENSQDGDSEIPAVITPKVSNKENSHQESSCLAVDSYSTFTGSFSPFSRSDDAKGQNRQRTVSECIRVCPVRTPRQRSSSESKMASNSTCRSKSEKKTSILKSKAGRIVVEDEAVEQQNSESAGTAEMDDGGSETEEKFHNFQLLMKCLVANEPDDAQAMDSLDEGHRTLSMSSDDTDDGRRSSPEVMKQNQDSHDHQCQVCQKTFLKKRYLTKHAFRMHPWLNGDEEPITKPTSEGACPHCKLVIKPRKDLQRHITNCCKNMKRPKNQVDLDLVSCQLCGVKMRRQLLVRHLAEEHCVDRIGDYPERSYPYGLAMPKSESPIRNKSEDESLLERVNVDFKVDDDDVTSKPSPTDSTSSSSSWQHVTEFGASKNKKDIRQQENAMNRKAASKTSMYSHM